MTILVTGATGRVGHKVVQQLVKRGADVRVLVRDTSKASFPAGVEVVQGDLLDIDALRAAFTGVNTLFLLNAVAADEFTQALITLNIARESGVERVVYLSVIHSDHFVNVPHFAVKFGAERMIERMGFGATILRPAYFIDNELMIKDVIFNHGVYPMPIGNKGIAMVDARDIAEQVTHEKQQYYHLYPYPGDENGMDNGIVFFKIVHILDLVNRIFLCHICRTPAGRH